MSFYKMRLGIKPYTSPPFGQLFIERLVQKPLSYCIALLFDYKSRNRLCPAFDSCGYPVFGDNRTSSKFPVVIYTTLWVFSYMDFPYKHRSRLQTNISTTKWGTRQYMNICKLYEGGIR